MKYTFLDFVRSRWSLAYFFFYLIVGFILLFLNSNLSKSILTLMNIILILSPLIGTIFGVMYYYSSREYTEILLAQPIKRDIIFIGQYLGVSISLSISLIVGIGIPFVLYGLFESSQIFNFIYLLLTGCFLTFIFTAISYNVALSNENKIKGFGYSILIWLFFALVYDALFITFLLIFEEYPLDKFTLIATALNPIDLSRILILLKLDISVLLGYTGAIFQKYFGTNVGVITSFSFLLFWVILPLIKIKYKIKNKDF